MSYALALVSFVPCLTFAQDTKSNGAQSGVITTNLLPPVYPPLARTARIEGDVRVSLAIGTDGEVKSANIVSGNQLLQQAALQSAQQSKFECRGCTESATYEMAYSFRLIAENCEGHQDSVSNVPKETRRPGVSQSANRVIVVAETPCPIADVVMLRLPKVRSPKCLYLWKCAYPKKGGGWQ